MIFVNPSQIGANPVVTCGDGLALNDGCVEDWLWICNDNAMGGSIGRRMTLYWKIGQ